MNALIKIRIIFRILIFIFCDFRVSYSDIQNAVTLGLKIHDVAVGRSRGSDDSRIQDDIVPRNFHGNFRS